MVPDGTIWYHMIP